MQLFSEYVQPITHWLYSNPEWALLITFLISFAESLAIIGSIVPGSITMTAIGILAGSGVMRVDLTLLAATLGAIVGDGISYLLGYFFSDRLVTIWLFRRYPQWLNYGKEYFARHGGKSVLIGRFFGPLRSIIPVIAGMMHMSHWRFYLANIISAIFWSLLYVLPGVLLGAASSELPPETAAQLLVLVLVILVAIWLATLFVKWLLVKLNQFLNSSLNQLWRRGTEHPSLAKLFRHLTPYYEKNHYSTAGLFIFLSLFSLLFILLTALVYQQSLIYQLNHPIHLAVQSLRNETIDSLFIGITQVATPIPLCSTALLTFVLAAYFHRKKSLLYWLSLIVTTGLCLWISHQVIYSPRPTGILVTQLGNSFPSCLMTYATVLFSSFLLYFNKNIPLPLLKLRSSINITFIVLLLLIGFGQMLLGDHWITDIIGAYFLGLVISLSHWMFYRKTPSTSTASTITPFIIFYISLLLISSIIACKLNYEKSYRQHQPFIAQYTFTEQAWWSQTKPLLPIYRSNRFGQPISLFNLQYAGSLEHFENALITAGWSTQEESFTKSLIKRFGGYPAYREAPLMAQLYLNHKPSLVMTYKLMKHGPILILRLWRSNYYLQDNQQRIWIGSVHTRAPLTASDRLSPNATTPLRYVQKALLEQFSQRVMRLPISRHKKLLLKAAPSLLLIREMPPKEN